jgi:dihydroorotase
VQEVLDEGPMAKMNPPLATEIDRSAVEAGIVDGTIDCIATDHAPHTDEEKGTGIDSAPFGIVGFETAFALLHTELVLEGKLSLPALIRRLTDQPARVFGLDGGRLARGGPADVAVFDPEEEWTVDPRAFRSRSRNTPWGGKRVRGRAVMTIVDGEIVFDER